MYCSNGCDRPEYAARYLGEFKPPGGIQFLHLSHGYSTIQCNLRSYEDVALRIDLYAPVQVNTVIYTPASFKQAGSKNAAPRACAI